MFAGEKGKNIKLVKAFAETNFWLPECRHFFSDNLELEFPVAPPGWLQKLKVGEVKTHFEWLTRTVKNWNWYNTEIYATNYPDKFWIKRDGKGDVHWAAKDGVYESRFVTLITVNQEKIVKIKDYFDMVNMYAAIGVTLPVFKYDAPEPGSMPDREIVPDLTGDADALKEHTKTVLKKFVAVDFWEGDEINANDIVHELPFAPPDMPRRYEGKEYDALNAWISKNCLTWKTYPGNILYETDHPGEFFIESGGLGFMSWTGVDGHYQQKELSYLKIENGYAKEFHEYFSTLNKFNSINVCIPTFPYLY